MLEFPRWKYALILVVLVLAVLYALPNAYQKNPSVQITPSTSEARIDEALKSRVEGLLTAAGVTPATSAAAVKLPASAARQNSSMLPS